MKYEALLFDWSGTLVDDLPPTLYATNEVLASYGVERMGREEFRERFRLPYPDFYEEVLPGVAVEDLEGTFRSAFRESPEPVRILGDSLAMLGWCRAEGIRCFVLSSMDVGLLRGQAEQFGMAGYFEEVYAGVVDKREVIGEILGEHGLDGERTGFIGDMVHDIDTARHGGVSAIAVSTGYDPLRRLEERGPDFLFGSLSELRRWLEEGGEAG